MKTKTPILYDKEGNCIVWLESEISIELLAQFRWSMAHTLKNATTIYRTPIYSTPPEIPSSQDPENS